jgi:tetratricopeptide (TPR) repeat protein
MTPFRGLVLAVLVGALALVQHAGLNGQPEKQLEDRYVNLRDVPPGDMVPTYVASLFFGAFRAVAIDILWIQLKRVREEKRWYEEREIFKFISYFQARNPEVWSYLAWDAAYNVSNGFTDPEERWNWYAFGLSWLRRGNRMLPDSLYLKEQLAYTLWHKPSWAIGHLDRKLLERFEKEVEFQKEILPPDATWERPLGMFEMAHLWLERARDQIFASKEVSHKTPMGRLLYRSTIDGFIQGCCYLQGVYEMKRGRPDEAKKWFRKAREQIERMLGASYPEFVSPLFKSRGEFYGLLPDLIDLQERANSGKPEDLRAFLEALQGALIKHGPIDDGFFWRPGEPDAPLNALKQKLAGGQDPQEFNDAEPFTTSLKEGDFALANLEPPGLDQDYYGVQVEAPAGADADARPAKPLRVRLLFNQGITPPPIRLKVTVRGHEGPLLETAVEGRQELEFSAPAYGSYSVQVQPDGRPDPWPERTRYSFQYRVER